MRVLSIRPKPNLVRNCPLLRRCQTLTSRQFQGQKRPGGTSGAGLDHQQPRHSDHRGHFGSPGRCGNGSRAPFWIPFAQSRRGDRWHTRRLLPSTPCHDNGVWNRRRHDAGAHSREPSALARGLLTFDRSLAVTFRLVALSTQVGLELALRSGHEPRHDAKGQTISVNRD